MNIKHFVKGMIGALLLGSSGFVVAKETAVIRLESGVALMKDESKLEDAVREFEGVLLAEGKSKKLAAEARYRMAECFLKLGDRSRAKRQVEKLLAAYPKENRWVEKAAALIPSGPEFAAVTWQDGEFAIYDVKIPTGQVVGQYYSVIVASEEDGEPTWTGYFTRTAGGLSQTEVEFDTQFLQPIRSRAFFANVGEFEGVFGEDGSWEVRNAVSQEVTASGKAKPGLMLHDNDQSIHLIRLLPNEVGDKISLPIVVVMMGGSQLDFELEAVSHESVETGLGEFDCVKYRTNIHQDFWVQRDEGRYLVKMKLPGATLELREVRTGWDRESLLPIESEKGHGKIVAPGGSFEIPAVDNNEVFRFRLTDAELRYQVATVELQDTANFLEELRGKNRETVDHFFKNTGGEQVDIVVDDEGWQEWEREDGLSATVGMCTTTTGEIVSERLQMCSHGKAKTLVLTFDCREGGGEQVVELARMMFESWEE